MLSCCVLCAVLQVDMDPETAAPTDTLAKDALFVGQQIGSSATTYTQAKDDPLWNEYITAGVKKVPPT